MRLPAARRWALLTAFFISAAQAQVPEAQLRACAACHGADSNSSTAEIPAIAAQPKIFVENYLILSREGLRGPPDMQGLLKGIPDRDIVTMAKHYSALPAKPASEPVDKKLFRRGKEIAAKNRCASCHDASFRGREQMPRLAGQREEFLAEMMLQYRQNRRPGGDTMMSATLYGIPEADFKALAHYFSRLK